MKMNEITIAEELFKNLISTSVSCGVYCGACFGFILSYAIYFGIRFITKTVLDLIEKHKNKKADESLPTNK